MRWLRFKTAQKLMNEYEAIAYKPFGKKSKDLRDNPPIIHHSIVRVSHIHEKFFHRIHLL